MFQFASGTFFWTIINFLIILFVIYKFALPPLFKLLDERENKRLEILAEMEKNKNESEKIFLEYQNKLTGIKEEAKQILRSAKVEKEQIKKTTFDEAVKEKQKILTSIKEELNIEKKRFIEDMRFKATDLVIQCTENIIKKELNPNDHEKIISEKINQLEKVLK